MKMRIAAIVAALTLAGCGGGGGGGNDTPSASVTENQVATFIDAPVSGLEFSTASGSGITDANGNFDYRSGESVTFSLGNLRFGAGQPHNGRLTPVDIVPGASGVDDPRVVRILQTLQSLDSDGDLENGIQISTALRETLHSFAAVDLTSSSTTDKNVTDQIGAFKVSAAQARDNFLRHQSDPSNADKGYTPPPASGSTSGQYTLVAWNDLGMHCVDGKDYSIFSILPPYNNLHAQLVDRKGNALVAAGVTLTYEATPDTAGSINTVSATKTNFWDWVERLFGVKLEPNTGLNLSVPNLHNPTPSLTPAPLRFNATQGWWEAEGIPITPYDDAYAKTGVKNFYPMVKVVARDAAGTQLASTRVVLPVSDEMSCRNCHASGSDAAARPAAGWVSDADAEKDWKRNILRLHDEKFPGAVATAGMAAKYPSGQLLASADGGQPVLCAGCHQSNALQTAALPGIKPLTEALHGRHASVKDPSSGLALDASTNRNSCYLCHPGAETKCLRGVMGNAKNPDGSNAIDCQSCHGKMSDVGKPGRVGWLDEPNCQSCHDKSSATGSFTRYTTVFDASGALRASVDPRFATTPNVPASGFSLYRFSSGHGGLQCESCHGATHAIYPSSHANDNVQSVDLQGHAGTIAECTVCHASVPLTTNKGPHGLHTIGQAWVSESAHGKAAESNQAACAVCHGADFRGSFLSATSTARSFTIEGRSKTFAAKQQIGCYDCHNGPKGGD